MPTFWPTLAQTYSDRDVAPIPSVCTSISGSGPAGLGHPTRSRGFVTALNNLNIGALLET